MENVLSLEILIKSFNATKNHPFATFICAKYNRTGQPSNDDNLVCVQPTKIVLFFSEIWPSHRLTKEFRRFRWPRLKLI